MSWDPYVKSMEDGIGKCKYAGIYGISPPTVWAESADKESFQITSETVANFIRIIQSQDMNVMASGIKVGKISFTCLRLEPRDLICQGKGEHKDCSLVVVLSSQACIIGFNSDPDVKLATLRGALELMRDHLCTSNY